MAETAASAPARVSDKFCAKDADVAFQSADGVLFRIHKINLKACTEGFAPPETATFNEYVPLAETASTLELLFQFIYPVVQPDLEPMEFGLLGELAEAAEKYQVYSAMAICNIHLTNRLSQHTGLVLAYALKHDYTDLAMEATSLLLAQPLDKAVVGLPTELVIPWVQYTRKWAQVAYNALFSHIPDFATICTSCHKPLVELEEPTMNFIVRVAGNPNSLQDLDVILPLSDSCCAIGPLRIWHDSLKAEIESIPSFQRFVGIFDELEATKDLDSETSPVLDHGKSFDSRFSAPDADVTYESSNGTIFRIHEANLKACSGDFPIPDPSGLEGSERARIVLAENSSTLELLFQFVYPMPRPDIRALEFPVLEPLAAAAEKYQVYAAMAICKIYMKRVVARATELAYPEPSIKVMEYALRSGYLDVISAAAPLYTHKPLDDALRRMPIKLLIPWVLYYERWNQVARKAVSFYFSQRTKISSYSPSKPRVCGGCARRINAQTRRILRLLAVGPRSLHDLDKMFDTEKPCCETRKEDLRSWRGSIEKDIQAIPKFESFLES